MSLCKLRLLTLRVLLMVDIEYESISGSGFIVACSECGAVVRDQEKHTSWHAGQNIVRIVERHVQQHEHGISEERLRNAINNPPPKKKRGFRFPRVLP